MLLRGLIRFLSSLMRAYILVLCWLFNSFCVGSSEDKIWLRLYIFKYIIQCFELKCCNMDMDIWLGSVSFLSFFFFFCVLAVQCPEETYMHRVKQDLFNFQAWWPNELFFFFCVRIQCLLQCFIQCFLQCFNTVWYSFVKCLIVFFCCNPYSVVYNVL